MIPGQDGSTKQDVLAAVTGYVSSPTAELTITSADLLGLIAPDKITAIIEKQIGEKPSQFETLGIALEGMHGGSADRHPLDVLPSSTTITTMLKHVAHQRRRFVYQRQRSDIVSFLSRFEISRPAIALTDREKALMRGMAAMYADGGLSLSDWHEFYALMVWADGNGKLVSPSVARPKYLDDAREILKAVIGATLPSHRQMFEQASSRLAGYQARTESLNRLIGDAVNEGARWLDAGDCPTSRIFDLEPRSSSLLIGFLGEAEKPLYFSGSESLITIGGPGSGKTQGQVIPNLLTYPGSVFILDIKGELYRETAEVRRQRFGPVYRFAPADLSGQSHRFNPLDCVPDDPHQAAAACQVLANELAPDSPKASDPYWQMRARNFIWAFAVMSVLEKDRAKGDVPTLSDVSRYLSLPTRFDEHARFNRSQTRMEVGRMRAMAEQTGLKALEAAAQAIENGVTSNRLESVFDTARAALDPITNVPSAIAATSASDWRPEVLRETPGVSIYFTLSVKDLRAFAPLVRLVFMQHVNALTTDFTRQPDVPPVTFFLDEVPQLGPLGSLTDIIDVGRGANLRLWMICQYIGQLRAIYGSMTDGLINSCAIRCFLQPDLDAARFVSPQLGVTRNIINGEQKPLAEPHDLMGRAFANKAIVLSRGEHPAQLSLRPAHLQRIAT